MKKNITSEQRKQNIYAQHDAGKSKREIGIEEGVRDSYVGRVLKNRPADDVPMAVSTPIAPLSQTAIDPLRPAAPQLEAGAWQIIEMARAGAQITVRQLHAAREIIKAAQRDKVPPPVSRKLKIVIDVIDVLSDDKIHKTKTNTYEVRP